MHKLRFGCQRHLPDVMSWQLVTGAFLAYGKGLFLWHISWLSNYNWCNKHYMPLQILLSHEYILKWAVSSWLASCSQEHAAKYWSAIDDKKIHFSQSYVYSYIGRESWNKLLCLWAPYILRLFVRTRDATDSWSVCWLLVRSFTTVQKHTHCETKWPPGGFCSSR